MSTRGGEPADSELGDRGGGEDDEGGKAADEKIVQTEVAADDERAERGEQAGRAEGGKAEHRGADELTGAAGLDVHPADTDVGQRLDIDGLRGDEHQGEREKQQQAEDDVRQFQPG